MQNRIVVSPGQQLVTPSVWETAVSVIVIVGLVASLVKDISGWIREDVEAKRQEAARKQAERYYRYYGYH